MPAKLSKAGKYLTLSNATVREIDLSDDTVIELLNAFDVGCQGLNVVGASALASLSVADNQLTTVDLTGCNSLISVFLNTNALTESAVDGVLAHLDAAGLEDGEVDLSGGSNSIPSAAGLTSKSNLEGKGWTVTVNS